MSQGKFCLPGSKYHPNQDLVTKIKRALSQGFLQGDDCINKKPS